MIDKLFPFHFVLDRSFQIVQKGHSLSKIFSDVTSFDDVFIFKVPSLSLEQNFDAILNHPNQLYIIEIKGCDIFLQGQFVFQNNPDLLFFCGNPWLKANADIKKLNLSISDFALHNSVIENANFVKTSKEEIEKKYKLSDDFLKQQLFFERLFDEIPVDMTIIDTEHRFRYLNRNAVKDDDLRKWMIGKTNTDYFIKKNLDIELGKRRETLIEKAIIEDVEINFEDIHHKGTEREVVVFRSISPFTTNDGAKYFLAYGLEITDIKKNYIVIEQKNKELEKLNKELNNLIYSITHDFRSPILAVKALIELLKKDQFSNQHTKDLLDLVILSIDKLDNQIIDIYNFIVNINLDVKYSKVDLRELVEETFKLVEHVVPYKVKLILNIEDASEFYTDQYRLNIILNNLISNAVKYSKNSDDNAFVEFTAKVNEKECFFSVRDNGEGIPENLKEKVFDIYFRVNEKVSGTGLGLFICSQAVEKLNGTIELNTILGEGSTFTVTIPNSIEDKGLLN